MSRYTMFDNDDTREDEADVEVLSDQDEKDLLDALTEAHEDLSYRLKTGLDYDPDDIAAIKDKLDRWQKLMDRFASQAVTTG